MKKSDMPVNKGQDTAGKKERKQPLVVDEYKDTVFRILYREDKGRQLELYNSVSGKNYTNADDLQVVTLKHAIYMGMKNDLAFLISDELHLYEHQSTINPNMPLRLLHYISKEYEGLVESHRLYGRTPIELPEPYFVVFYNGTDQFPERKILRLSELFRAEREGRIVSMDSEGIVGGEVEAGSENSGTVGEILNRERPLLELKVLVLNINPGKNDTFLGQCSTLREYMEYVARVRKYRGDMELREAVSRAVDECIEEGILEDFLRKNKAEVVAMSIFEYDEKKVMDYIRMEEREEGRKEGRREGRKEGRREGRKEGRREGRKEGQREGRKEGRGEEARKYNRLIICLNNEGKGEMIVEAARDDELRERSFEEYGL